MARFTVLVMQPIQVKAFGRVHLRRAKNDTLDATLIAARARVTNSVAAHADIDAPDVTVRRDRKALTVALGRHR